ncbi:MAG: PEPxxWA-CTERM sorting domain-containing protein [Rubrivivax sp.]|nr:PEPxxWA-CTERM sorting domain-containing protein [Rubrivivax sp.]
MKLVLCATVAGAALAAQSAYAEVISVDFSGNAFSTVPFNIDGFYLNVVTGATGTSGGSVPGWDMNPYFSGATTATPAFRFFTPTGGGNVGAAGTVTALAVGDSVGPGSSFITGALLANNTGLNYFGFRFVNEATATTNYGYVAVSQAAVPPFAGAVQVLGYAYDNTGVAITVVPEPSAWLMMLGGLAVVGATLRKRAARQQDAA